MLVAELRKLTEYMRIDDHDYCPGCAARILPASAWPGAPGS